MIERQRLIPAVILGAMGLLALKLIGWSSQSYQGTVPASPPVFASASVPIQPDVRGPAPAIVRDHPPAAFFDPETTGSVDKPSAKEQSDAETAARLDAERAANPNNKAAVMNGTVPPMSPSERAVLERLSERRAELEARQRELEMREKLLDTAEKKLDGRVDDLKNQEDRTGDAGKPAAEAEAAIKNLVIMYEAMKPKDAARVFDRLGLDVLVPVVQKMNPRKMSEVLAAMAPERAEKLTIALAGAGRGPALSASAEIRTLPGTELPAIAPQRR